MSNGPLGLLTNWCLETTGVMTPTGREDQDKTWLDGPVASVKGKSKALE